MLNTNRDANLLPFAPVLSTFALGGIAEDGFRMAGRHFASAHQYNQHGNVTLAEVATKCAVVQARIAQEAEDALFRVARERD